MADYMTKNWRIYNGKIINKRKQRIALLEVRGIEPRAFHMQSERSTTELHPRHSIN